MMMHNYLGDNLFDEDWADTPLMREYFGKGNFLYGKHAKHLLRTDVRETEDAIEADIDLPGFKKDEIQVHLENGYLSRFRRKACQINRQARANTCVRNGIPAQSAVPSM